MDIDPFPTWFVPNAVTLISVRGGQNEVETSKVWLHIPPTQEEAGIVAHPQIILLYCELV